MLDGSGQLSPEAFPGSLLPSQYFAHVERRKRVNGEYRLLLAVLEDAIRSYLINISARNGEQRVRLAELRLWFYARGGPGKQGLFAFESICELLGIEADLVRKRLGGINIRDLATRRCRAHLLSVAQPRTRRQRTAKPLAGIGRRGQRLTSNPANRESTDQKRRERARL